MNIREAEAKHVDEPHVEVAPTPTSEEVDALFEKELQGAGLGRHCIADSLSLSAQLCLVRQSNCPPRAVLNLGHSLCLPLPSRRAPERVGDVRKECQELTGREGGNKWGGNLGENAVGFPLLNFFWIFSHFHSLQQ